MYLHFNARSRIKNISLKGIFTVNLTNMDGNIEMSTQTGRVDYQG